MNRRERRLKAASARRLAPVVARQEKSMREVEESLAELRNEKGELIEVTGDPERVERLEQRILKDIEYGKETQRRAEAVFGIDTFDPNREPTIGLRHRSGLLAAEKPEMSAHYVAAGLTESKKALAALDPDVRTAVVADADRRLRALLGPIAGFSMTDSVEQLDDAQRAHETLQLPQAAVNRALRSANTITPLTKNIRDFDELLAAWGRTLWEVAHLAPDYDAEARLMIADAHKQKITSYLIPEALMFASVWAVDAFQRITTTHTFAAALMCSDPDRGALEAIERQWRGFMIMVPDKLLTIDWTNEEGKPDSIELTRILVSVDDASAKMVFCYPITNANQPVMAFSPLKAPTFADLLLDDPETMLRPVWRNNSHPTQLIENRIARMAQRLVAGLLLAMQNTENVSERSVNTKPGKNKRTPGSPAHRHIHVGRPLNIDLRPNVKEYVRSGKTGKRHGGPPTVQVLVRGHYRQQVCGVGRLQRKRIWILPFWRGPEEAIINVRPKLKAGA
jgi:hypothetical protein